MFLEHSNITIFGTIGSGKSYLCRKLQGYFPNVFIFDTLFEYNEQDGIILKSFQEFSKYVLETKNRECGIRAIIRFSVDQDNSEEVNEYLRLLYHRGNCTVVIEEVQNFGTVHKIPHYLKQISLTGRHKKINFITTTQRIAEIHKSIISQSHNIFSGHCDNPLDIGTLKSYGFSTDLLFYLEKRQFIWKRGREYFKITNDLEFLT